MKNLFIDQLTQFNLFKKYKQKKSIELNIFQQDDILGHDDRKFTDSSINRTRIVFIMIFLCIGTLLVFIGRLIYLQIISGDRLALLSNRNSVRNLEIPAERGIIYDTNGHVLARNKPAFSIELNIDSCSKFKRDLQNCKNVVDLVAKYLYINKNRAYKQIDEKSDNILLASSVTKDKLLNIEANIHEFQGLYIITSPRRDYIYSDAFAHVLGYIGLGDISTEILGKSGVEESYNTYLTGIAGSKLVLVNSYGQELKTVAEKTALPGRDLTLFIDSNLQNKAFELLKKEVEEGKADAGAVVASNPQTGGILALVSYPSYDPNSLSAGISEDELNSLNSNPFFPFFNRAISAVYPPGSTIKMIIASAALSENIVSKFTTIFDKGFIQVGTYVFRNWKLGGHGEVNITRALQVSNDTFFYTVGGGFGGIKGLGINKIYNWATKFGYGKISGIDIAGEVPGNMPNGENRDWYLGDTYITSIGQGDVLATPLQVNNVMSHFSNGGYIYKPRVVKQISGVGETEPEIIAQNLTDQKTYEIVREGLKKAVLPGGTAYPMFDFPQKHGGIYLGGKTGTSEYNGADGKIKTHAWFTVFGPFDGATIALTVFLEGGGSGSDDAAPIARQLIDLWFSKLQP